MHTPLENIRNGEIQCIRPWINASMHVLEVGGGDGYQAGQIAQWGCRVESLDVPERPAPFKQHFPVQNYDGRRLPFRDEEFDVVFSSNVLEHLPSLPELLPEMRRVLKRGGLAIHILPSTAWRFWTGVTHYPNLVMSRLRTADPASFGAAPPSAGPAKTFLQRLRAVIIPPAHGEYPNAVSELYFYSAARWKRLFRADGMRLESIARVPLFYTGHLLFPKLPFAIRRFLAYALGAAANIYVLRKEAA